MHGRTGSKLIVDVDGCEKCPFFQWHNDGHSKIPFCEAPHESKPKGFDSVLNSQRLKIVTPQWCPLVKETVIIRWGTKDDRP